MIGETFGHVGEAILATEVIKEAGKPRSTLLHLNFCCDVKLLAMCASFMLTDSAGVDPREPQVMRRHASSATTVVFM